MIHVLTHYTTNWKEIADITVPVMEKYCAIHGFGLHVKHLPPYEKYDGMEKLSMLGAIKNDDIALVLDVDVLLTNLTVRVEDLAPLYNHKEIYLSEGANCGVMIIKKGKNRQCQGIRQSIKLGIYNCEQDAVEDYLSDERKIYFSIMPHPAFNSYLPHLYPEITEEKTEKDGKWMPGHFCLHVPGLDLKKRAEVLKEYSQYIVL